MKKLFLLMSVACMIGAVQVSAQDGKKEVPSSQNPSMTKAIFLTKNLNLSDKQKNEAFQIFAFLDDKKNLKEMPQKEKNLMMDSRFKIILDAKQYEHYLKIKPQLNELTPGGLKDAEIR